MKLNQNLYRDKLHAAWIGKNIGGTMGTPYEGGREYLDIKGFVTDASVVLPNDDLDLQLVWLSALEARGPYRLTAADLGEFWLSYIVPYWNEYGIGKTNMRLGMFPPLSGDYRNTWRHSNGAWIRTEIWASLAPGAPDIAVKYAIEDATVDHGAGEGTIAAAFVAAMQSSAYVVKTAREAIDIALTKIPEESRVAKSVRFVIECYEGKKTPRETRDLILKLNADIGDGWFEAPSNVAYTVLGLLFGEGDFKKSMITAINCGDDTDCTGATVGATLGILGGMAGIPDDWKAHIGESIVTISINRALLYGLPTTCAGLTDRVAHQTPLLLAANHADIWLTDGESEIPADAPAKLSKGTETKERLRHLLPFSFTVDFAYASATLIYETTPDITPGGEVKVKLIVRNNWRDYGNAPYNLNLRWFLPDGFTVSGGSRALRLPHFNAHDPAMAETEFTLHAGETVAAVNRAVLEITAEDRFTAGYVPVVMIG